MQLWRNQWHLNRKHTTFVILALNMIHIISIEYLFQQNHPHSNRNDPYHLLTRHEQVSIFRLRTGHNRLRNHLFHKLKTGDTDQCRCRTGSQTTEISFSSAQTTSRYESRSGQTQHPWARNSTAAWRTNNPLPLLWRVERPFDNRGRRRYPSGGQIETMLHYRLWCQIKIKLFVNYLTLIYILLYALRYFYLYECGSVHCWVALSSRVPVFAKCLVFCLVVPNQVCLVREFCCKAWSGW